jgi:hypothetical protein
MIQPPTVAAHLESLLVGAAWQDSLLQGYRLLTMTLQSLLLLIGTVLFAASFGERQESRVHVLGIGLFALAVGAWAALVALYKVVQARGRDVDFWHVRIILMENSYPTGQRVFTTFKLSQKANYGQIDPSRTKRFLSDAAIDERFARDLVEAPPRRTRTIVDKALPWGMGIAWAALVAGEAWRFTTL